MRHATTHPSLVSLARLGLVTLVLGCGAGSEDLADRAPSRRITGRTTPAFEGTPSVVLLTPSDAPGPPAPADPAVMDQFGIAFIPRVLVSRTGQPVEFRNSEDVMHNVRVVETATDSVLFNVTTPMGEPHVHTFARAGAYAVACDIHPGMRALLLVSDAPYAVVAEDDGAFSISDVPPGSYTVTVWRAGLERPVEGTVRITEARTDLGLVTPP